VYSGKDIDEEMLAAARTTVEAWNKLVLNFGANDIVGVAKPAAKSTSQSKPVDIATRLLVELVAHGLKADPVTTAWAMRKKLPGSINKLGRWLEHFMAELFIDASRENQERFLDNIGIERLLGGMSPHMLDVLRERVAQDQGIKAKASKAAEKNEKSKPPASAPEATPPVAPDNTVH
jgi:hypothetical protein